MSLRSIKYVTETESLDTGYDTFLIDASGGNITFSMHNIQNDGEQYLIKRTDSSGNTVTVQGFDSSQTIEGEVSITLNPGDNFLIVSTDSTNWVYFN